MLLAQNFVRLVHFKLKIYNKLVQNCFHVPKPSSFEIKCSNGSPKKFRVLFFICFSLSFVLSIQTCWYFKYGELKPAVTIQSVLYTFANIFQAIIAWHFYQMRHQVAYLFNNMIQFEFRHNGNFNCLTHLNLYFLQVKNILKT